VATTFKAGSGLIFRPHAGLRLSSVHYVDDTVHCLAVTFLLLARRLGPSVISEGSSVFRNPTSTPLTRLGNRGGVVTSLPIPVSSDTTSLQHSALCRTLQLRGVSPERNTFKACWTLPCSLASMIIFLIIHRDRGKHVVIPTETTWMCMVCFVTLGQIVGWESRILAC